MESTLSASNMQDPSSSPLEKCLSSANGNGDLDSEEGSSLEETGFNWGEYLEETGASAAPHTSFKHVEISIQSNFQPGMKLEVANKNNPDTYWVATIITTCGQLLLLRYCGYGEDRRADFWCDVVIADLHPVGWCTQNNKVLMPPDAIKEKYTDWTEFLIRDLTGSRTAPANLLEGDHADLRSHFFTVGMKLETVNMSEPFYISPASVTKVFNNHFFQVTIDDLRPEPSKLSVLCHADSLGILPVQWCLKNGVSLTPPKGFSGQDFDWADYHKQHGAQEAPPFCFRNTSFSRGFTKNMKLEAVNPRNPGELCVASVVSVKGRLMWLHLEGLQTPIPEVIVDVESMDIFPVGWCEANSYPLTTPHKTVSQKKRKIAVVQPEKQLPPTVPVKKIPHDLCLFPHLDTTGTVNGKYCCPQLFINHRCFSGPYLNKGRIAELPQSVGPGKCVLVLKEVLSMIINAAYKPGRVLRELQLVEDPHWNFQEETLKAKYRGKTYRAVVKIVRTSDQVANFCRRVCAKLECCPNLFSPVLVSENCPENCSIHTKTKYTYYYGKRKKISKPPIGESNPDSGHPKPARRRKRRKSIFVQKKRRSSAVDFTAGSGEESEEEDAEAMDDDTASEETGSELRDDQTDTSSAEVPSARPRRAVTLRSGSEPARRPPAERTRRGRRAPAVSSAEEGEKCPPAKPEGTEDTKQEEEERLVLESNPLEWTVTDVVRFIKLTDCAPLAKIFQEQDIDGQALLLLTLPTVQECMELKLGPAIKLCHQIERVKVAFYAQYAN
ncbi:scm-like with four MBT domains protein 2 isoform X3 [Trachypithecus francoisi]|uniref:scm-like with four MBT domains protein 2 isoform X3 n=1 Tax=Trachypithecus francoisi TaxID=54180 RepID=UPI00141A7883|nr:scm-like with four MBT domains protein 2 isoform X3 [Trachypithecus francoisi]